MPSKAVNKKELSKPKTKWLSHRSLGPKHIKAAVLEATGKTNAEIMQLVDITIGQLAAMRRMEKYQVELKRQIDIYSAKVAGGILGSQINRLKIRDKLYQNLQHIRKQRKKLAEDDPELEAQGGLTGLVVAEPLLSAGRKLGTKYSIDHETIDQIKSLANETAKDLGQLGGDKNGNTAVQVNITFTQEDQAWL
jgi:hypothetical protein